MTWTTFFQIFILIGWSGLWIAFIVQTWKKQTVLFTEGKS